ncbi:MAG TPA: sulfate ABC transporter permease subunit CysW [Chthoniobacteraceae bacterium]|nr:sulfate ABC transporter permease subunit CysW [Chthoniobacteraceae bacterium]
MAGAVETLTQPRFAAPRAATAEAPWVRWILITLVTAFFAAFLLLPLAVIFAEAFSHGVQGYLAAFKDPATFASIRLTLLTVAIAVPLNTVFGLAAAWAITRFDFRGRDLLISLIDLPVWVSPVVGGLLYILLLGPRHGVLGPWLTGHNIKIIFAPAGIIIATNFVTFPFVARSLIPLMHARGCDEEEAALTLGANGWQIFFRITLPKIKWALVYGVILCNARAMGEFGAVSVVSGHVRGLTNTIPLQVEILYNDYAFTSAFAVASLLSFLALITLGIKTLAEWQSQRQLRQSLE